MTNANTEESSPDAAASASAPDERLGNEIDNDDANRHDDTAPTMSTTIEDDDAVMEADEEQGNTENVDRHCLVALWEPTKNPFVRTLDPSLQKWATKAEEEADEAVCVCMEDDGSLTVHTSKHSVVKSLAAMGVKLCIVWPLGLAGALGIVQATSEIEAATRKRTRTGVSEDDLAIIMEQMKPGWCALIAIYKEFLIPAMVQACLNLDAVAVWDGKESKIEDMIRETNLEEDLVETREAEGKLRFVSGLQYGTSMEKPEDKARTYCSGYVASLGKRLCCCCTCVVAQLMNFL